MAVVHDRRIIEGKDRSLAFYHEYYKTCQLHECIILENGNGSYLKGWISVPRRYCMSLAKFTERHGWKNPKFIKFFFCVCRNSH